MASPSCDLMPSTVVPPGAGTPVMHRDRNIRILPSWPNRQHSAEVHHMFARRLFAPEDQREFPPPAGFLENSVGNVKPFMRHRVAEWMLETSDNLKCASYVFAHAMILFDNFLQKNPSILVNDLQLLGASTLLLAGKCVDSSHGRHLSLPLLCASADDDFDMQKLKTMELAVLQSVNWNPIRLRKPHDYINECFAVLCESPSFLTQLPRVQRQTCVFIDISYLDHTIPVFGPETIAAAALQYAMGSQELLLFDGDDATATENVESILHLGIFTQNARKNFVKCIRCLHALCKKFDLCNLIPHDMKNALRSELHLDEHNDTSKDSAPTTPISPPSTQLPNTSAEMVASTSIDHSEEVATVGTTLRTTPQPAHDRKEKVTCDTYPSAPLQQFPVVMRTSSTRGKSKRRKVAA